MDEEISRLFMVTPLPSLDEIRQAARTRAAETHDDFWAEVSDLARKTLQARVILAVTGPDDTTGTASADRAALARINMGDTASLITESLSVLSADQLIGLASEASLEAADARDNGDTGKALVLGSLALSCEQALVSKLSHV